MLLELICLGIALIVYFGVYKPHRFWKERGVRCCKSVLPILGNIGDNVFRRKSMLDVVVSLYQEYPHDRYVGMYQMNRPILMIRDLELIKKICVKDFDHFVDHTQLTDPDSEVIGNSLIGLRGEKWREMRNTLSPAFTGSKMRAMFVFMNDCAKSFAEQLKERRQEVIELEMKDFFSRFTSDVIASVAFGVKCDSMRDPKNEFFQMGRKITNFSGWQGFKFFMMHVCPSLAKALGLKFFPESIEQFFKRLVKNNIRQREEQGIVRRDFIHLLLEARKGKLKYEETDALSTTGFATVEESQVGKTDSSQKNELTDDLITAQALLFFFAGFETASTVSCFMAHELAVNPDIQKKLQEEIDAVQEKTDGKLTYEALTQMKYLDQVVSESLRLWTPAFQMDRQCVKDYIIEPVTPDETSLVLKKGQTVTVSVGGIHRDPQYFPEPLKFDPERFSDENKAHIRPGTYIPFGVGPRNCIGSRFALLELKTLLFHVLAAFDFVVVEKTMVPLQLSKKSFNMTVDNGFWLGLKSRGTHVS